MLQLLVALLAAINIEFSWDAQTDTTSYKMGVATIAGGPYTFTDIGAGTTQPNNRISYLWTNWDQTTKKYVVVKAHNAVGDSNPSSELTVGEPSAPKNFSFVPK